MKLRPSNFLIVTSCTLKKRATGSAPISTTFIESRTIELLARSWLREVARAKPVRPIAELYSGRGFSEARAVATALSAPLYVVSAGLGLIRDVATGPAYNATITSGEGSLRPRLQAFGLAPADWWTALGQARANQHPLSQLLRQHKNAVMLVALPSAYIEMVSRDLSQLAARDADRVRIFTSPLGVQHVPDTLAAAVMPYDNRLEATARPGTPMDFAQRAMRHFVEDIRAARLPLQLAGNRVRDALANLSAPTLPPRERRSDAELIQLIVANWERNGGSSTRLLRYLRDDALVRCEQSRFRALWLAVKGSITLTGEAPNA